MIGWLDDDARTHPAATLSTGTLVAIKVMSKAEVIRTRQVEHIKAERDILDKVNHPFIVKLLGSSQDERCLHFVLEYVVGGGGGGAPEV